MRIFIKHARQRKDERMRILSYLVLFCLLATAAAAALDNEAFSTYTDWYHTEESIEIDGHNILINLKGSEGSEVTKLLFDDTQPEIITNINDCVQYMNLEVCLEAITYEFKEGSDEWATIDPRTKRVSPGIKIQIKDLSPVIKIRHTMPDEIYVGQQFEIEVEEENYGDSRVRNLIVSEVLPSHIEIIRASGIAAQEENAVVARIPALEPDEDKIFRYIVRANENAKVDLMTAIEYTYLDQIIRDNPAKLALDVDEVLLYDATFTPQRPTLQNTTRLNAVIENQDDEDGIDILEFSIPVPDGIEVVATENITFKNGIFTLSEQLDPEEDIGFSIDFKAIRPEAYSFDGTFLYGFNDEEFQKSVSNQVSFANKHELQVECKFLGENMLTQHRGKLWILLRNENFYAYDNVIVSVTSDLFGTKEFEVGTFAGDAYESIGVIDFTSPDINTTVSFKAEAKVFAKSSILDPATGRPYSVTHSDVDSIDVLPPHEAFEVEVEVDPDVISQNSSSTVTVTVENLLDREAISRIEAADSVPAWLISGKTKRNNVFFLEPQSTVTAYSYEVFVPYRIPDPDVNITTTVTALNVTKSISTPLSILYETAPELSIDAAIDTELSQGVPTQVTFMIKNTGDFNAYDLRMEYIPVPGVDVAVAPEQEIELLEPDEQIELTKVFRPVRSGSAYWKGAVLSFKDMHGNLFSATPKTQVLLIQNASSVKPLVIAKKDVTLPDPKLANVSVWLHNKGSSPTTIVVEDTTKAWEVHLAGDEQRTVSYMLPITGSGNVTFPSASYSYGVDERSYSGLTEAVMIERDPVETVKLESGDENLSDLPEPDQEGPVMPSSTDQGHPSWLGFGAIALVAVVIIGILIMKRRKRKVYV